ncbi:MAG: 30S ribosomal protein S4 [Nanoarchaeota archaeon]
MGDPRKRRKQYTTPADPWQKERIDEEKVLLKEHGLKNKKELWREDALSRNFKYQAKRLISLSSNQSQVEGNQLLKKLNLLGLLEKNAKLEDVLSINVKNVLERRLQTVIFRKKIAKTINQARQFITHRHIAIGDKIVAVPSYLVKIDEESAVNFRPSSSLFSEDHPERKIEEKKLVSKSKKSKKDDKKADTTSDKKADTKTNKKADTKVDKKADTKADKKPDSKADKKANTQADKKAADTKADKKADDTHTDKKADDTPTNKTVDNNNKNKEDRKE